MNSQPFIINLTETELPNLSQDNRDSFGLEFSHTSLWQDDSGDIIKLLNSINEKLELITEILIKNGRE